jgi:hypothetical protein
MPPRRLSHCGAMSSLTRLSAVAPLRAALLSAIAALLLAAGAGALPSAASAKPLYGVQGVPATAAYSMADIDSSLDVAKSLHAKVVRIEVLWSRLEPSASGVRDPAELAAIDRAVNGAAARGMGILLMMDSTPCWASTAPDDVRKNCTGANAGSSAVTRYPPAGTDGYVALSTFLAQRYGAKLTAFEIWNEPDQSNEYYWAGPNKVQRYVALAQAVYKPLKQANPKLTVLAGSFVGANGKWLDALYRAGIKGSYDALSVHFYDLPLYALRTTRAVQHKYHDNKPLWLAEFGFTSCYKKGGPAVMIDHPCLTQQGQAQNLVDTLRSIARYSWVKAAVVYRLRDESQAYQFGVLTAAGKRKPAFAAVRNVFSGGTPAVTRPRLTLRSSRGRLVAQGTASQVDVLQIKVHRGAQLVYNAYLRTDRFGAYKVTFPAAMGQSGLKVTLSAGWTGTVTKHH